MIGQVYRVRTHPLTDSRYTKPSKDSDGWLHHCAKKGSLAVVLYKMISCDRYMCQVVMDVSGEVETRTMRPCDLQRVEFHEEVNN